MTNRFGDDGSRGCCVLGNGSGTDGGSAGRRA
jgi:hypothetical protein